MKLFFILLLTTSVCNAQLSDTTIYHFDKGRKLKDYFLRPVYTDTTKCKILISKNGLVQVIDGYRVYRVGYDYARTSFLDIKKHKLPKEFEVWDSKPIE